MKKKRPRDFEKRIEKVAEEFSKEIEYAFSHAPKKTIVVNQCNVFGLAGPLLKAVLSIFLFIIVMAVVQFFSRLAGIGFIVSFIDFVSGIIPLFFLTSLLSNYIDYFSERKNSWFLWPLLAGIKTYVFIWIWIQLLGFLEPQISWNFIPAAAAFLREYSFEISLVVTLVCYGLVIARKNYSFATNFLMSS